MTKCSRCQKEFVKGKYSLCESCLKYGRTYKQKNQDKIIGYNRKRSKKKRIRSLKSYSPVQHDPSKMKLLRMMEEKKISVKQLAEALEVSQTSVLRWIFIEGQYPNDKNRRKLNAYFDEIVFTSERVPKEGVNKQQYGKKKNS